MYIDDIDTPQFKVSKDTREEQQLRTLLEIEDYKRPPEERYLQLLYASLTDSKASSGRGVPHSSLFYCREALEAKFPDRKFTIQEVKDLILEVYGVRY